jgi:hypothetical protein
MLQQVTASNTLLKLKSSIPMGIVQYTGAPFWYAARSADLPRYGPEGEAFFFTDEAFVLKKWT